MYIALKSKEGKGERGMSPLRRGEWTIEQERGKGDWMSLNRERIP